MKQVWSSSTQDHICCFSMELFVANGFQKLSRGSCGALTRISSVIQSMMEDKPVCCYQSSQATCRDVGWFLGHTVHFYRENSDAQIYLKPPSTACSGSAPQEPLCFAGDTMTDTVAGVPRQADQWVPWDQAVWKHMCQVWSPYLNKHTIQVLSRWDWIQVFLEIHGKKFKDKVKPWILHKHILKTEENFFK